MPEKVFQVTFTHHVAEQTWIAEVPELQGCVAFGHSQDEVTEKLRVAMADYLELFERAERIHVGAPVLLPDLDDLDENVMHSQVSVGAGAC